MAAIQLENVTKVYRTVRKDPGLLGALKALVRPRFQTRTAMDGITLSIDPGEVVGYIGINGAGKSTTIKVLTGILCPTSGTVRVLGRDPYRERVANAREISVVFGQRTQLWWDLAFRDSLDMIAGIYQIPPDEYRRRLVYFVEMLDLGALLATPLRSMSLGQKMRAELMAALLHQPRVVYLDEPTIGLDIVAKERIRAFIKEQNRAIGMTVLLTTHDLGDIEELCTRVVIIDAGRIIYDGSPLAIKAAFGAQRVITFETQHSPRSIDPGPCAEIVALTDHRLVVRFDGNRTTAARVTAQIMEQVDILDFSISEADLGSIIKAIYAGTITRESLGVAV